MDNLGVLLISNVLNKQSSLKVFNINNILYRIKKRCIFDPVTNTKYAFTMFTFSQYLGFIAFLVIALMGFWLLIFLSALIPYWIGGALKERFAENRAAKKQLEE